MNRSYSYRLKTPLAPEVALPTEEELRAIDRSIAIAKEGGAWDSLRDHLALRDQLQYEALIRAAGSTS